jgi:hypothetical protein
MPSQSIERRKFVDEMFLGEIEVEARYCIAAATSLNAALGQARVDDAFRALHSLLAHAAMVSKFLWPGAVRGSKDKVGRMKRRATRIRRSLQLSRLQLAPLRRRTLRDHLEHFDERLDDWGQSHADGLVDRVIGPRGILGKRFSRFTIRQYDPGSRIYVFKNERFNISAIIQSVRLIAQKVPEARRVFSRTHT